MINTNYNENVAGSLSLISVNGQVYQLGKDASASVGGIMKLYNELGSNVDGAATQAVVKGIDDKIGTVAAGKTVVEMISDAAAGSASTVAAAANDYITVSSAADATDGHMVYTIGTNGIDGAISSAIAGVVAGAPEAFDTLKEIADWITDDTTGAAAVIAKKADKVENATANNFAGLDANGNLKDSGFKAADFQAAGSYKTTQTAVANIAGATDKTLATLSQNANGEISYTMQNIQDASASQHGLMSAAHYSKLEAISMSVSNDTLVLVSTAA